MGISHASSKTFQTELIMPYAAGKLAYDSIIAFMKRTPLPFPGMAQKLRTSFLDEKDFKAARKYTKALRNAALIPAVNIDTNHGNNIMHLSSIYMAVAHSMQHETPDYDEYVPAVSTTYIAPDAVLHTSRGLPIHFSSQRIEDNFEQGGLGRLDYGDGDFINSLAAGLVIARHMGIRLDVEKKASLPVAVPHLDGLFLGSAFACDPKLYLAQSFTTATKASGKFKYEYNDRTTMDAPMWTPRAYLNLHTFVPEKDFVSSAQADLHGTFMDDVFYARGAEKNFSAFLNAYCASDYLVDLNEARKSLSFVDRLAQKVLTSPAWDLSVHPKRTPALN